MEMKVICLEEAALFELIDALAERFYKEDPWIPGEEAMRLLNIKSKTTLQSLRDNDKIRFSQPTKGIILYNRDSIYAYLEANTNIF